jgi:hypothetical protein
MPDAAACRKRQISGWRISCHLRDSRLDQWTGRSSVSVIAGPASDVLRVSRKILCRFGPASRPQIRARWFARCSGPKLSSGSRNRLVLRQVENRARQDWIDAVRRAGVARSRFVSSLRDKGFPQLRRNPYLEIIGKS